LKADDFFWNKFATSTLVFKKITSKSPNLYTVTADLTIKDTKPVTFDSTTANTATANVECRQN
jgi:polyisoprenoid-binding protein YceI